jgi:UDP-2-acetamido-3-amino-2,3-dideoxy-glucuronate N-acetyltransferase
MTLQPSDLSNPPRVAVLGAGYWGKNLVRNFRALGALAAVCDPSEGVRRALHDQDPSCRVLASHEEALHDTGIDAVAIATPAETHGALVGDALRAGKDVLVEKPLCLSLPEGEALAALARERGRILMVGHLLWYHPAVLELKRMIDAGDLGRIHYVYSHRLNFGKIRREENILWSFAPHDISVILGLLGEMPESVQAQGGFHLHPQIADVTVSCLSFPSGIRAHIFVSWLHPFKEQKLVVVGDRQMAVFDDLAERDKLVLYPHTVEWRNQAPVAQKADARPMALALEEPLKAECLHFLDCVRTRRQPRTDADEGLRVLRVLQQCQQALEPRPKPKAAPASPPPYHAHLTAVIDEGATIGAGTSIWHFSHVLKGSRLGKNCKVGQNVVIGPNAVIGDGVKIQNNVSVYEGVTLEDHVFCGPSMVFTNVYNPRSEIPRMHELRATRVRRGATLGANCTIVCGVTIGRYALVGAGALVRKDVPDFALVVGNPGRIAGWVCACGERIDFPAEDGDGACRSCRRPYRKQAHQVTPHDESPPA